jgi:hypothetical protein
MGMGMGQSIGVGGLVSYASMISCCAVLLLLLLILVVLLSLLLSLSSLWDGDKDDCGGVSRYG